jgi:hypothetical protein
MSAGGPDLFVVCKSCGSEVSPYITECPYCGSRLRKRAPKIDRDGRVSEKTRRKPQVQSLGRLRHGEIPGIRGDSHPYATIVIVVASLVGCLLWRTGLVGFEKLAIVGKPGHDWWLPFSAAFTYDNTGYAFAALTAIGVFGWLLERRHGPIPVIALFLIAGAGSLELTATVYSAPFAAGAGGAGIAMVVAWALPDLIEWRQGVEVDGDLLGAAVIAAVVALMPIAVQDASWLADGVGALAGLALGYPLAGRPS